MNLTRQAILQADDLKTEGVEVPEWGGTVLVRQLTLAAREQITAIWTTHRDADDATKASLTQDAVLLSCVVDDAGALLFLPEDIPAIKAKNAQAVGRVIAAAMALNGMGATAVGDAAKN